MADNTPTDIDRLPEDIALAIEIIRQLENLDYEPEVILQAMTHVFRDTLNKLPTPEQVKWQHALSSAFKPED